MSEVLDPLLVPDGVPSRRRDAKTLRRFIGGPLVGVSVVVLAVLATAALFGGRLWHYGYAEITPEFSTPPSWAHPMGTDGVGHDGLAQVLRGAQKSMQVALLAALVSTVIGVVVGAAAGFRRGWIDATLMRLTDLVLTVPGIAVLIVLAGHVRGTAGNWMAIALIVASLGWPATARVVRAVVLSLREQAFVEAARAAGARDLHIIVRHVVPHAAGPVIVRGTFAVGGAIFAETGLSYLGLGISPPDTSLGSLVAAGQAAATTRPWLFYFPGLSIALIVLTVNLLGDALRDALDPHTPGQVRTGMFSMRWSPRVARPAITRRPPSPPARTVSRASTDSRA
ncbi:MAG: ABC transporter permease [Actinomycetota bacterium]|nr:ABC transporter permease [Actinomycetota bacterium]